jgi:DMSO/TMAO reductase YedYZ molybdopterin-dependent catalytic subunit
MSAENPFARRSSREHAGDAYFGDEVRLAHRNSGIPLEMLRHDVTPVGAHYLLSHFDIPYIAGEDWKVEITGAIGKPHAVTLAEIERLPQRTIRVTLECAGNGRALMAPRYPSMPWHHEAVGTAEWTGTPLRHVLEHAGLEIEVTTIAFIGADRGSDNGVEHAFGRALSREHALSDDVLLVHAMNGAPLLPQHGFPLRLIVPGWYGMASVKWLTRIEALTGPFDGYQQARGYHYRQKSGEPGVPVREIRVKSLMVPPGIPDWYTRERLVEAGRVEVFGRAWSGNGVPIAKVEFACDGVWQTAALDPPSTSRFAWRGWRCDWEARHGEHELMCRATDANGATQPLEPMWDNGGFGNNAVQSIKVWVR